MSIHSITELLDVIGNGGFVAIADAQLADLVAAVKEHGRSGELRLSIKLKPATDADEVQQVVASGSITLKLPAPKSVESILFTANDDGLSLRDPRQPNLPFPEREPERPPSDN